MTKLHEIAKALKVLAKSVPAAVNEANKAHKNTQTPRDVFRLLGVANQIERLNERAQAILVAPKVEPKAKAAPVVKVAAKKVKPAVKVTPAVKKVVEKAVAKAPAVKKVVEKKPAKVTKATPVAAPAEDEV